MLRYKKHKKHTDGLAGSGVGVMDDTDREVSSFTDRAFRSLCVAEEEVFNDVPHIPSPIRGMPLSTKYHLGIFNLSVRKTQPLAQLPSISQQRGKWAPTFQPLLNCAKDRLTINKTNSNKLCVPQPMGYKPSFKVSSLIQSFDNVENERPEQHGFSPGAPKGKINMENMSLCQKEENRDVNSEALEPINPDNMSLRQSLHLNRRTAREVFLESQAEISSKLSGSPCSLGSPLPDQGKKVANQRASLRRTAFLHSENSAFKSWSDIGKRGDDSDSSIPGTPPILRSATPCSPLLQRTTPGVRSRDVGLEVGWSSPASTLSNSFDTIQMLRSVPPLPTKRMPKQSRELSHRAPKVQSENKILAEDMQVDLGNQSPKEQLSILSKSTTCPKKMNQTLNTNQEKETVTETSYPSPKQNEEVQEKVDLSQDPRKLETSVKEDTLPNKSIPSSGRIKTLIKQIEKESVKDVVPHHLPEKKHTLNDSNEAPMETLPSTLHAKPPDLNSPPNSTTHVPPWRRMHLHRREMEDKLLNKGLEMKESPNEQAKENITTNEEDSFEEKPIASSFNITNLLTPVIRRKSIQEAIEEQPMAITPPPDALTLNDQDQTEISLYRKRNEYKSKATSLLFNLKDMRKRVKCTYNPSTSHRNGLENNQTADGRLQDVSTHRIPLTDTNKQVNENVSNTDQEHVPRLTKEEEAKQDLHGNASDNYLCLSSPSQATPGQVFENAEIPTDDVQTNKNIHNEVMPSFHLSPTEYKPKKNEDYPILNLYPKNDTSVKDDHKNDATTEQVRRQNGEELPLQEEKIKPDIKQEEPVPDPVSVPTCYFLEGDVKNAESHIKQSLATTEDINKCSFESEEGGKQNIKSDNLEDALQYYAVNNGEMESNKEENEIQKKETEEKVEENELVGDKQREESTIMAEIKTPSNIIQFKPNLFHIKDNKIKSSPVTKSVRPLFRSLSEDCLLYHKGEDYSFTGKGDFRVTTPSSWKNRDSKIDISKTRNIVAHNGETFWNLVATKAMLESPDNKTEFQQIKAEHEDREVQEILEKPLSMTPDWRRNEEEATKLVKVNKSPNKHLPSHDGPFFHPVETCVSEVTGLSPECNNLLLHHERESIKDFINGEHESSTLLDSTNTKYSPLDDGPVHFEDAISYSEDIVCSTITSPMSESITCSMVASPMSVNTQSSGFTTALSALDDLPSPPCTNSRNGKFNLSNHDMSIVPTLSNNLETKANECMKQPLEKPPSVEPLNKGQAAKPPTVPPKTEKALRRAKRLTKKRRKTEIPPKIQEGEFQESDFVLDVPSPANNIPSSSESNFKVGSFVPRTLQQEELMSEPSTPSLPITQRKLLQDPNSGQYFVVDIPVHLRIKTFFDPETGKYLQMSLPTSPTPPLEMSPSPFMLYQGLAPVPVTSIASLKKASQMLNHSDLYSGGKPGSWQDGEDNCLKMQQFIDCDSCDRSMTCTPHSMAATPHSLDRNAGSSRSPDIISMRDIDDFAMEAIS